MTQNRGQSPISVNRGSAVPFCVYAETASPGASPRSHSPHPARQQSICLLYCLMPNHVHLLLTPVTAQDCAALMRELGQRYVQYFNRRYKRSGTLWEGRWLMRRGIRILCARLLPIHRAKPGPRVPRCEAGRLPVVQLPRKFWRSRRIAAIASSRIPGFGRTSRRAICRLRRPFRARARAIASGRHSKCDQWRLPPRQRIVQVGTSRVFRPKGGAGAAWPAQQGSAEIGL